MAATHLALLLCQTLERGEAGGCGHTMESQVCQRKFWAAATKRMRNYSSSSSSSSSNISKKYSNNGVGS